MKKFVAKLAISLGISVGAVIITRRIIELAQTENHVWAAAIVIYIFSLIVFGVVCFIIADLDGRKDN